MKRIEAIETIRSRSGLIQDEILREAVQFLFQARRGLVLSDIVKAVNEALDVNIITDSTKRRKVSEARAIYYYIAREHTDHNYEEIASFVGRNHSTALQMSKRIEDIAKFDKTVLDKIETVKIYLGL